MNRIIRISAILTLAVTFASCVIDVPTESVPSTPASVSTPTKPETVPQEEPMKEPVTPETPTPETPTMEAPVAIVPVVLRPITVYPAYIIDQCGTLWGIPETLQGEYDKVHLAIETADGIPIPSSELDIFTLDGVLYITRTHTVSGNPAIDYYRQEGDTIVLVDSIPAKPVEARVRFDSPYWLLETSVISGVEYSYLYNRDPDMIRAQGNAGGKGARMGMWPMVSGFAVLDRGMLIMTTDGALFFPQNRACGNAVSEYGRLWK